MKSAKPSKLDLSAAASARPRLIGVACAIRSQAQVAAILTARGDRISRARVYQIEKRAIEKLSRHPEILALVAADLP